MYRYNFYYNIVNVENRWIPKGSLTITDIKRRTVMRTVVKMDGLIKKYDNKPVVDNLTLEIREGEIFGVLRWTRKWKDYERLFRRIENENCDCRNWICRFEFGGAVGTAQ